MQAAEFDSLTDSIRRLASTAASSEDLQRGIVELIGAHLPSYNWAGFYMLDPNDPNTLVLGPFVGEPTPHVRIPIHQGICGAAVSERATVIVDDVHSDPRYLSCSIKTRSEIVVPIFVHGQVVGEIDIDSHTHAAFTGVDRAFLEEIARITGEFLSSPDRRAFVRLIAAACATGALLRPLRASAASKTVRIARFNAAGVCTGVEQVAKIRKTNAEWKQQLTPEQYAVARQGATERAGTGKYAFSHTDGIYCCICCETALFDSKTKFDAGTGWPSFWQPIAKENVTIRRSYAPGYIRDEVLCTRCDAHLGDVFDDGPPPTHRRFCIDSAALNFLPSVTSPM